MSQAVPKSRSRSNSPAHKSRSRSASPVRKVNPEPEVPVATAPNSVQTFLFPKLEDYIAKSLGERFRNFSQWNDWQTPAEDFMATHCPEQWTKGQFTDAALAYMFAIHSLVHYYGSQEVQAIVNQFCTINGYRSPTGREFLQEVEKINLSCPKAWQHNSVDWIRGWSRMVRHMNQGIPLVQFSPDGRAFPFYHSIFKDGDFYNGYVVPESLSFRSLKKGKLAEKICEDSASVTAQMLQENPDHCHSQILDDIFLWNSHLFVGNGFTLTEDVLGGAKDKSITTGIQEIFTEDPDLFEVKQVVATRISLKEGAKF